MNIGDVVRTIRFEHDLPVGTVGKIIKFWSDRYGNKMVKLYFGKNLSGQKLQCSVSANNIEVTE